MALRTARAFLLALAATAGIVGCATVDYAPYEARDPIQEGKGGTKVVYDGIDFWADGAPPRRYKVLGIATAKIGEGAGADSAIRSAIAQQAKSVGGNAAVEIDRNTAVSGYVPIGNVMAAARSRTVKFAIVRYE